MGRVDIPPNFGKWLVKTRLTSHQMTQNEMILKLHKKLSRREIIAIESGQRKTLNEDTVKTLAEALEMSPYQLIENINKLREEFGEPLDDLTEFSPVLANLIPIDDFIRHFVRSVDADLRRTSPEILSQGYRDLLFAQLSRRFSSLKETLSDFPGMFSEPETAKSLLDSMPKPDLIIDVQNSLEKIKYVLPGGRALTLSNPELLWDCCCLPSEGVSPDCTIHNHSLGEEVTDCIKNEKKNITISYRGFDFHWKNIDALWPPSADSFYLLENILEHTDLLQGKTRRSSIIDIGAGTGFFGIVLAFLVPGISSVCLTDWTTTSYLYSCLNWFTNSEKRRETNQPSFEFRLAVNTDWNHDKRRPKENKYDLVICNPPYLPIPERFRKLRAEQTTAGTELLEHVIAHSRELGETVIIQFSHLVQERAQLAAKQHKVQLRPFGEPKMVPFRIVPALENEDYMDWLLDKQAEDKGKPWALIRGGTNGPANTNMKHQFYHYLQSYFVE